VGTGIQPPSTVVVITIEIREPSIRKPDTNVGDTQGEAETEENQRENTEPFPDHAMCVLCGDAAYVPTSVKLTTRAPSRPTINTSLQSTFLSDAPNEIDAYLRGPFFCHSEQSRGIVAKRCDTRSHMRSSI
jgi:hypothetical protein